MSKMIGQRQCQRKDNPITAHIFVPYLYLSDGNHHHYHPHPHYLNYHDTSSTWLEQVSQSHCADDTLTDSLV